MAAETARQHLLGYLAQLLGYGSPILFNLVVPVLLGPVAFGTLTVASGLAYLALTLLEPGIVAATIDAAGAAVTGAAALRVVRQFALIRIALFGAIAAGLAAAAPAVAAAYGLEAHVGLVRLAACLLVGIGAWAGIDTALIALRRNAWSVRARVLAGALCLGLPLAGLTVRRTPEVVLAGTASGYALAALIAGTLGMLLARRPGSSGDRTNRDGVAAPGAALRDAPDASPPTGAPAGAFARIAQYALLGFGLGMQTWGILAIAGMTIAPREVGFLKIAIGAVQAAINLAPFPALVVVSYVASHRADPKALERYLRTILEFGLVIAPTVSAACALLAWRAVALVYGPDFAPVASALAIVALSFPALLLLPPLYQAVAVLEGRRRLVGVFAGLLALEALAAAVSLARFGLVGGAIVLAVAPYLFLAAALHRLRGLRSGGMPFDARALMQGLAAAACFAAGAGAVLMFIPGAAGLMGACAAGGAGCAGALWATGALDTAMRRRLRSALPFSPQG